MHQNNILSSSEVPFFLKIKSAENVVIYGEEEGKI